MKDKSLEAYEKFAAYPLVDASGGVDRASFIAGYETHAEQVKKAFPLLVAACRSIRDGSYVLTHSDQEALRNALKAAGEL